MSFMYSDCVAYSGEDDRRFRANVTGDSTGSALLWFFTLVGHDQSIFSRCQSFRAGSVATSFS
jgi:hypothetical protein